MTKSINLAFQGGGAHGAYTWGVADKLLEDGRIAINAITATSAGAMNAAALAYGFHIGGVDGAREKLREFWRAVADVDESLGMFSYGLSSDLPGMEQMRRMFTRFTMKSINQWASPYQLNPFDYNPLKDILSEVIDFEELNKCEAIRLFITATNVKTGKAKIFRNPEICADRLLASACLPNLYKAVEIDGEFYWDGGYMGNPSLWPLFYETDVSDLLVVHINPIVRDEVPTTPAEIDNRVNEISFNTALLKEMRAIAFVQKLVNDGWLKEKHKDQLANIRFHSIRADKVFSNLDMSSKYDTGWSFLEELMEHGRTEAAAWLDRNEAALGKHSTVNLHEEFLDV